MRAGTDDVAFREFYDLYAAGIFRFFARRAFNAELAMDLTGETFAVAWIERAQFRGRTSEEEQSWLYAIARSQLARFCRRGDAERRALAQLGVQVPAPTDAEIERVEQLIDLDDDKRGVAAALRSLPDDQRRAVEMRIVDERDYREIATLLDVSEQVVRARVSRGLRAMGRALALQEEVEAA